MMFYSQGGDAGTAERQNERRGRPIGVAPTQHDRSDHHGSGADVG